MFLIRVLLLLLCLAPAHAALAQENRTILPPKDEFHLFLLIGQSNMAGRGKVSAEDQKPHSRVLALGKNGQWQPAIDPIHFDKSVAGVGPGRSFGIAVAESDPTVTVGLIPAAVGGSPISKWHPGEHYRPTNSRPWDDAIQRARQAMKSGTLKGILWHQGESDSKEPLAEAYEGELHALVKRLRDELDAPHVPFIAGQLGQFAERPWDEAKQTVDQAHRRLPETLPHTAFVSSDGLDHKGDEIHFSATAARELGHRYAAAYFELRDVRHWPQFRGPNANGITQGDYPTQWDESNNVRWRTTLPRPGNGSPVVWGDKVFVCSAEDSDGLNRTLYCLDTDDGSQCWRQTVSIDEKMPTHKTNPYGGSTPATDGKRVIVWHGSAGLHAYNMDGTKLWSRDLGEFRHMWGYGSSPLIVQDRVILNSGPGAKVFVAAFDLETGETLWQHDEPVEGDGERNEAGKYMGTWSTPVPLRQGDQQLVVAAMHKRIVALDVRNGQTQWYFPVVSERGDLAYSSPMLQDDICLFNAGFRGPSMAFKIMGEGDLSDQQLWRIESNPQSIGTGVIIDGYAYRVGAGPNLIECLDIETGEFQWQQRHRNAFWGSIALAGDTAYATDQRGETVVFRPSPDAFHSVATCELNDSCNATPALADGRIYIRTAQALSCIAPSNSKDTP